MIQYIKSAVLRCFASTDSDDDEYFKSLSEIAPIPGEHRQRNLFRRAIAFAKRDIKDPKRKEYYAVRAKPGQRAYHVAISMYLRAHKVHS